MRLGRPQRRVKELKDISGQLLAALNIVSSLSELEVFDELAALHWEVMEENRYVGMEEVLEKYITKVKELNDE